MINTLIPLTGDSNVVREKHKKFRFMKKEYLSPETLIVPVTTQGMMAFSSPVIEGEGDEFGVKEENTNTTNGSNIWDNEW